MKDNKQDISIKLDALSGNVDKIIEKLENQEDKEVDSQLPLIMDRVNILHQRMEGIDFEKMIHESNEGLKKDLGVFLSDKQNNLVPIIVNPLTEKFDEFGQKLETPKESIVKKQYSFNFGGSRHLLIILLYTIALSVSLMFHSFQDRDKKELKDSDLQFRYILMKGGINGEELNNLRKTFYFKHNKKLIKEIQKEVEDFEYKTKRQAELHEQLRLLEK